MATGRDNVSESPNPEGLHEAVQFLSLQDVSPKPLKPQESTGSIDSGLSSRRTSDMIDDPEQLSAGLPNMQTVTEEKNVDCPVKINVEGSPKENSVRRKVSLSDINPLYLAASRPTRKDSFGSTASSNTSDEYLTPPTSPSLTIFRHVPLSRPSSPAEPSQELTIEVKITSSASKDVVKVNTKTILLNKIEQLQLNLCFQPPQLKRSSTSPASSPTSPTFNKKLSLQSDSLQASRNSAVYSAVTKSSLIQTLLKKNLKEFEKSTDLDALYSHLFMADLISRQDWEELKATPGSRNRNLFFYMILLDKKGPDAYKRLFECLKNEHEHLGHKDLVKIIREGLRDYMSTCDYPF